MTITKFDKTSIKALAAQIVEELVELGKEEGLSIERGNASFDATSCELKLKIAIVDEDGIVQSRERNEFKMLCKMYNLVPDDLGRKFIFRGTTYRVTGLKGNSRKNPIMVDRMTDGRGFALPQAVVVAALHPDRDPDGSFNQPKAGKWEPDDRGRKS